MCSLWSMNEYSLPCEYYSLWETTNLIIFQTNFQTNKKHWHRQIISPKNRILYSYTGTGIVNGFDWLIDLISIIESWKQKCLLAIYDCCHDRLLTRTWQHNTCKKKHFVYFVNKSASSPCDSLVHDNS